MFSWWKFFSQKRGFCGFVRENANYHLLVLERKSNAFLRLGKRNAWERLCFRGGNSSTRNVAFVVLLVATLFTGF